MLKNGVSINEQQMAQALRHSPGIGNEVFEVEVTLMGVTIAGWKIALLAYYHEDTHGTVLLSHSSGGSFAPQQFVMVGFALQDTDYSFAVMECVFHVTGEGEPLPQSELMRIQMELFEHGMLLVGETTDDAPSEDLRIPGWSDPLSE